MIQSTHWRTYDMHQRLHNRKLLIADQEKIPAKNATCHGKYQVATIHHESICSKTTEQTSNNKI